MLARIAEIAEAKSFLCRSSSFIEGTRLTQIAHKLCDFSFHVDFYVVWLKRYALKCRAISRAKIVEDAERSEFSHARYGRVHCLLKLEVLFLPLRKVRKRKACVTITSNFQYVKTFLFLQKVELIKNNDINNARNLNEAEFIIDRFELGDLNGNIETILNWYYGLKVTKFELKMGHWSRLHKPEMCTLTQRYRIVTMRKVTTLKIHLLKMNVWTQTQREFEQEW